MVNVAAAVASDLPAFPTSPDLGRRWASKELRTRRLTRFGNDSSHPDFSLLLCSRSGKRLFPEKTKRVKDLSFPADFHRLYDHFYVPSFDFGSSNVAEEVKASEEVAQALSEEDIDVLDFNADELSEFLGHISPVQTALGVSICQKRGCGVRCLVQPKPQRM